MTKLITFSFFLFFKFNLKFIHRIIVTRKDFFRFKIKDDGYCIYCGEADSLRLLPLNEVVCVHDYSEGYRCRQQDELQSEYFDVAKVSLHITILYHHAVEFIDRKTNTEDNPQIIKEHLFVISDDEVQDYHSVHKAQELVKGSGEGSATEVTKS